MKENKASRTAAMVAATRAWHSRATDTPVFNDPFAALFTPLLWRAVIGIAPLRRHVFENNGTPLRGIAAQVIARSRYAEDCLWESIENGNSQYVIVGAGYDSFGLRYQDEKELSVYELDHPATQHRKRNLLSRRFEQLPNQLHFVPVDFSNATAGDALRASAFNTSRPAFFSWLGTTPYLSNEDTLATLSSIASAASSGSELVFDYLVPDSFLSEKDLAMVRQLKEYTVRSGEPILGAFAPDELAASIGNLGFEVVENLPPSHLERRYFAGRKDDLRVFGATYFMRCRCK